MSNQGAVLILTGDYGAGHLRAAEALKDSLQQQHPHLAVQIVDVMSVTHPIFSPVSKYMYLRSIHHFPRTYGFLFRRTRQQGAISNTFKTIQKLGLHRLHSLIDRMKPSAIVSTFPLAAGAVSILKRAGLVKVPCTTVITDYTDHSYWLYPHTDLYLVGSNSVAERLRQVGISGSRIAVTGIPVKSAFYSLLPRQAARELFRLQPDMPTIMIMGGGEGLVARGIGETIRSTHRLLSGGVQFIVVCGRNEKLQSELTQLVLSNRIPALITGYTEHIPEFMAASDLLITKPGGLTSSEALAAGLPMVLVQSLPGQEEDNAAYLTACGAALRADELQDVPMLLMGLLRSPDRLRQMIKRTLQASIPNSADVAVSTIMRQVANALIIS
ncbi:glycosyltransferase [Paenibacillus sp. OV219]|uniref:MGDG synthase family glycosyltransferase n=1 Tax=Paenibacillus sp. OV219 TaxID=1884377 RepID=UPI0008D0769D|nr:glycosyltransferase [Paenibacillus sp. OV219]SEO06172.1 processive 1,2-diacylglycerol beta-glucosyltransferase [Paenibacillus sp. OV219]